MANNMNTNRHHEIVRFWEDHDAVTRWKHTSLLSAEEEA